MAGRGRGRVARTPEMQKAYDDYRRELAEFQAAENAAAGLSYLSINEPGTSRLPLPLSSPSSSSGTGTSSGSVPTPLMSPTPTPPDSDSPPSPLPSISSGRGRGRGGRPAFQYETSSSPSDSTASPIPCEVTSGPLRPPENFVLDDGAEDDSENEYVARLRKLNAGILSKGRGRGKDLLNVAISTNLTEENVIGRPVGRGRGRGRPPLQAAGAAREASSAPTSYSSGSDIVDDLAVVEREVVVRRGVRGMSVPVTCNSIRLSVLENVGLFEYYVRFDPPMESRRAKRLLLRAGEGTLGTVKNFDGEKLYLPFRLPDKRTEFVAEHPFNSPTTVKTTVQFVKASKLRECVHFYNVLFRRIMEHLGYVEMKRNFYDYRTTYKLPQHKLEIWPGFITAIDEYEGGLMLLCDSSFRVLSTETLYDVLRNIRASVRGAEPEARQRFLDATLGQIIVTKYNNRNYKVDGIEWDMTPLSTFNWKGQDVTYVDYYAQQYGEIIRNTDSPLILNRPKDKCIDPRRPAQELIYLIPELCYITGLSEGITSNIRAMQDMAHYTRITPQKRNTALRTFVQNVKGNPESKKILANWGLELEDGGVDLEARLFKSAPISFGNGVELAGSADFNRDAMSNPCFHPVAVKNWAVFCTNQDRDKGETLVRTYRTVCRGLGIQFVADAKLITVSSSRPHGRNTEEFRKSITQAIDNSLQFIVVIVPRPQDDLYGVIKKICCVENPIPSQVVLSKTLSNERRLRSVVAKIVLQINCKLGGALWTIRIPMPDKIMFLGMDVYHDPKKRAPSIMGLVASLNETHTKYFSRVCPQGMGQEIMDGVRGMFKEALISFHKENNRWPDRIVVFRDGVGDGQLDLTENHEVVQMTELMDEVCENKPKFSFTVVQKRIHTRIFAHDGRGGLENPKPGTVLDHTVTRRYYYDFFLVSQLVREGTVTPTHYIVLKDDQSISPDLLQKFAFVTSFMYYNWAGSIRVPAVCQYAHKLAYLVGQHLKTEPSQLLSEKLFYL